MKVKIRFGLREEMVNAPGKFHKSLQLVPSVDLGIDSNDQKAIDNAMRNALSKTNYKRRRRFMKEVNI